VTKDLLYLSFLRAKKNWLEVSTVKKDWNFFEAIGLFDDVERVHQWECKNTLQVLGIRH